jgi:hypothetical protein
MAKAKEFEVEVTSAIVIDGVIVKPGKRITVGERMARNLLDRGKVKPVAGKAKADKPKGPIGTAEGGAAPQGDSPADEAGTADE